MGNLSKKVGGEAPHLVQWFPGSRGPFRPPQTDDFRTDVLKLRNKDLWGKLRSALLSGSLEGVNSEFRIATKWA